MYQEVFLLETEKKNGHKRNRIYNFNTKVFIKQVEIFEIPRSKWAITEENWNKEIIGELWHKLLCEIKFLKNNQFK